MATLLGSNPDFGALKVPDPVTPATLTPDAVAQGKAKFDAGVQAGTDKLSGVADKTRSNIAQMDAKLGDIPLPSVQQVPKPEVKQTSPQEQWGSAAMVFAVIGSMLTRTPMTTALNAAAGVLQAYHKGDQDAANSAFQSWKVAQDNALKLGELQQKTYSTLVNAVTRREGIEANVGGLDERAAWAQIQANAAAFKDPVMMQAALDRDAQAVTRLNQDRDKLLDKIRTSGEALNKKQLENEAFQQYKKDNPNATPMELLKKAAEIQGEGSPAHAQHEKVQADRDEKSQIRLTAVQNSIDQAIALTNAGGVSGVGGMLEKGIEVAGGAAGFSTGGSPAHQFENLVSTIRAGAEAELSTPGSRSNPQFRQALANLAPMIGPGQSAETQANALKHLSNFISEMNGQPPRYTDVSPIAGVPKRIPQSGDGGQGQKAQGDRGDLTIRKSPITSGPGSSYEDPVPVKSAEDLTKVKPGTWYRDGQGVKQRPDPKAPSGVTDSGLEQTPGPKPPSSGAGSSIDSPVTVHSQAEIDKLPVGTWFSSGGAVRQKREFDDPKGQHSKIINQ